MEPAAEPAERGFSRTVLRALRRDGVRVAFVVALALFAAPTLRRLGFATAAEQLERELGDPRMLGGDQVEQPRSAADLGVELIDEIGMPEGPARSTASPEDGGADGDRLPMPEDAEPHDRGSAPPVEHVRPETAPVSPGDWLNGLREKEARELQRAEERRTRHLRREGILFRTMLVIGVIAAVFALIGALLLSAGLVPAGVVSLAVALLPGSGSVLIRDLWNHERKQAEAAETARSEYAAMVEAAQAALSLPDEADRSREALEIARRLRERAFTR